MDGTIPNGTEQNGVKHGRYSMLKETEKTLETLIQLAKDQIPQECRRLITSVTFDTANTGSPYFPCPFKETEAVAALKAVEAGIAASIANLIEGKRDRRLCVNLERASAFVFSAYLSTIAGMNKGNKRVTTILKGVSTWQLLGIRG